MGFDGELICIEYFENLNYKLIAQRSSSAGVEIDLIFKDECNEIHFVEVKTRSKFSEINFSVSGSQKKRLLKSMQAWGAKSAEYPRCHLAIIVGTKVEVFKDFLLPWA